MYTTNQTKQFCVHNPYFSHYRKYNDFDDRDNLVLAERYCRKYKKTAGYVHRLKYGDLEHTTLNRNMNYFYAWKEFERKFPGLEQRITADYEAEDISCLSWRATFHMNNNGRWYARIISCDQIDGSWYSYPNYPFIGEQTTFEYTGILDKEHMADGIRKYIERFLYAPGRFRDIQLSRHWDKSRTRSWYKYFCNKKMWAETDYLEAEETAVKWIIKHLNVDVSGVEFDYGLDWVNKHGKQKHLIKLGMFDYSFADFIDGDINEIENAYWGELENYPENMYFIN